ncbi:MAG: 16S rRNA (guanine(527)-N(7))-methyltransferase RsmG [Bacteroidales bacterium]|nr:16S rRNA (guanine(527)-N(7))-methyltransferase RsmG [Bacteroidales bacterium]
MDTSRIFEYFKDLSATQKEQFNQLKDLYLDWNSKINVISRKDMEHFYEHHVLHSLAIGKYFDILPGMKVMDLGTGGGFPGIPLAILFPEAQFYLIDGTGKKINVVNAVKDAIGLQNVVAEHKRAEEVKEKFDIVTGRAVMTLPEIANLAGNKLRIRGDAEAGGILYLKGGDLKEEFKAISKYWHYKKTPVSNYFKESYFEEKYVIHLY